MSITNEQLTEHIASMTVLDLANLVKELETKFGVFVVLVVVVGAGFVAVVEEKIEFDVVLLDSGDKKINVIKEVRAITGLGLKEAKDIVESTPKTIKEAAGKDEANEIKKKLETTGAKVELK